MGLNVGWTPEHVIEKIWPLTSNADATQISHRYTKLQWQVNQDMQRNNISENDFAQCTQHLVFVDDILFRQRRNIYFLGQNENVPNSLKTHLIVFHTMPLMQSETVTLRKHVLTKSTPVYRLFQIHTIKTHKAFKTLFKGIPLGQAARICLCVVWNIWLACESKRKKERLRCSCRTPSKHTGSRLELHAECVYI